MSNIKIAVATMTASKDGYYRITIHGCRAVHLMGIGYHGKKLENAVRRAETGNLRTTAEREAVAEADRIFNSWEKQHASK